jgi:tRNA pseudouridine55 synthase
MTSDGTVLPVRAKRVWRKVDGVVLLDKPLGMSSNQALQAVRRLFGAAKAGHTGTLDPLATGLLPLCFGEATKFSGELLGANKRYSARVRLGIVTDTADAEGTVVSERPVDVSFDQLVAALEIFRGDISQVPPMYSALKRDGKPLYQYARAGIELEREARQVRIIELRLGQIDLPYFEIDVLCSKGTYIRTLAADIGEFLGCGAHLAALRRTGIGLLDIGAAVRLDAIAATAEADRMTMLLAPDGLLAEVPVVHLDAEQTRRMRQGQALAWANVLLEGALQPARFRLYACDGGFLGVGRVAEDGMLRAERLVVTQ